MNVYGLHIPEALVSDAINKAFKSGHATLQDLEDSFRTLGVTENHKEYKNMPYHVAMRVIARMKRNGEVNHVSSWVLN